MTRPPNPDPATFPYVVVSWERGARLFVLDVPPCDGRSCPTPAIIAEVETSPGPHNVVAAGQVVWVTHPREGRLSRYDVSTGKLVSEVVGSEPHDVALAPDGSVAYVSDEAGHRLVVVDPNTLNVVDEVPLPARPHNVEVVGTEVWVSLDRRDELAVVSGDEPDMVPTGGAPHDLVVGGDGRLWISQWGSADLLVVDPATWTVEGSASGLENPQHFAVTPTGALWVSDNDGPTVAVFDAGDVERVEVGVPQHHLGWVAERLIAAGAGEIVVVGPDSTATSIPVGRGLHGVATGTTPALATTDGP